MVLQANHGLVARHGRQRRAERGNSFNQSRMHATMDDAVRLAMVRADFYFCNDLIGRGTDEMDAHGGVPAAVRSVEGRGIVAVRRGGQSSWLGHKEAFYAWR